MSSPAIAYARKSRPNDTTFKPHPNVFSAEEVCRRLGSLNLDSPTPIFSFALLKSSVSGTDCSLCRLVHDAVLSWPEGTYESLDVVVPHLHRSGLEVTVGSKRFEICAIKKTAHTPVVIPMVCLVSDHTSSEESLRTARQWMVECITRHSSLCGQPANSIEVPFRVLDLGLNPLEADAEVILREALPGNTPLYACLSHCWGKQPHFRTIRDNIDDHKRGIPFQSFPRTFQEAIQFTRRLNFRYLWIDSLCIIQEDEEDWHQQSAIMGDIYRNAAITLSASASSGSREGMFRPSTRSLCLDLKDLCNRLEYEGILIRERLELLHSTLDHPLTLRGWVLQERLLSPRVLHFGKNELMWECMSLSTCSCMELQGDSFWLQPKQKYQTILLDQMTPVQLAAAWRDMVRDYSRMRLTCESDIFPAISGIVKIVQQTIRSRYLAGLWESTIFRDLFWTTNNPALFCRPRAWRAPTWSWASVSNREAESERERVQYRYEKTITKLLEKTRSETGGNALVIHPQLLSADVSHKGPDATGPLKAGHIILRGQIIKGKTISELDSDVCDIKIPGQFKNLYTSSFRADYNLLADGPNQVKIGSPVGCLKLMYMNAASWNLHYLFFLVLRQVGDAWERIGLLVYQQRQDLPQPHVDIWFKDAEVVEDAIVKIV